jgi:dTDP-glucose 4,6-dehydratase
MKVLITGGSGFIGSFLVKKFIQKGHVVLNLDKLSKFSQKLKIKSNKYKFKKIDLLDKEKLKKAYFEFCPKIIVNAAAESHVDRSIAQPTYFFQNNLIGTINLLNLAKEKKAKFIHISTDEVFGSLPLNKSKFNNKSRYDPRSPYSASKAASDHAVRSYGETYNLDYLITNCSNNYGPYQYPEKLIPVVILNCLKRKKIPVYGNGKNIRDWIFVEDHVDAIYKIAISRYSKKTFLIGGDNEVSNNKLVEKVCNIFDKINRTKDSRLLIEYVKDRPGHDLRYAINNNDIKKKINWRPKKNFEQGLRKTINFFLKNNKNLKDIFYDI